MNFNKTFVAVTIFIHIAVLQASDPCTISQKLKTLKSLERRFKNSITDRNHQRMIKVLHDYEALKQQGNTDRIVNFRPLIDKKYHGQTALHYAVRRNEVSKVAVLLQFDADVNSKDASGMLPITIALAPQARINQEMINILIDAGAFIQSIDTEQRSLDNVIQQFEAASIKK